MYIYIYTLQLCTRNTNFVSLCHSHPMSVAYRGLNFASKKGGKDCFKNKYP